MVDDSAVLLDYLEDVILAAEEIGRFVEGMDRNAFVHDEKTVDAVLRDLEVIGDPLVSARSEYRPGRSRHRP